MAVNPLNGMKVLSHLLILALHYSWLYNSEPEIYFNLPTQLFHSLFIILMMTFVVFFVIGGFYSAKWLTRNLILDSSLIKVWLKFYFQRLSMIVPNTYLLYFITSSTVFLLIRNIIFKKLILKSLPGNIFFISNLVSVENNASLFIVEKQIN